jgi:hypothetical protein
MITSQLLKTAANKDYGTVCFALKKEKRYQKKLCWFQSPDWNHNAPFGTNQEAGTNDSHNHRNHKKTLIDCSTRVYP